MEEKVQGQIAEGEGPAYRWLARAEGEVSRPSRTLLNPELPDVCVGTGPVVVEESGLRVRQGAHVAAPAKARPAPGQI